MEKTPRGPYYTQDPEWYADRRDRILEAREEGQSLARIADTWGITAPRVRQIAIAGMRKRDRGGKEIFDAQAIKPTTPKMFRCSRCEAAVEALPTGLTDVMGGTHYVYTTPKGWWSITTRTGMLLFCGDETVTIVAGEIAERQNEKQYGRYRGYDT